MEGGGGELGKGREGGGKEGKEGERDGLRRVGWHVCCSCTSISLITPPYIPVTTFCTHPTKILQYPQHIHLHYRFILTENNRV